MFGWQAKYCEPCVFTRFRPLEEALWSVLERACKEDIVAPAMGAPISTFSLIPGGIKDKLELHGIPQHLWSEIDELVTAMFEDYRAIRSKDRADRTAFGEREIAWLTNEDV